MPGFDADAPTSTRRRVLAASAAATATLTGCLGFVAGDEPAAFAAEWAVVSEDALEETGYEESDRRTEVETRTFGTDGASREVEVTSRIAEYDRAIEILGRRVQAAVFLVYATPRVEVLGQSFNPVADMDDRELVERGQRRYEALENVERRETYDATLLDEGTTVGVYDADARIAGTDFAVDVTLHATDPVESEGDFVVAAAGYPDVVDDADAVATHLDGVDHPA